MWHAGAVDSFYMGCAAAQLSVAMVHRYLPSVGNHVRFSIHNTSRFTPAYDPSAPGSQGVPRARARRTDPGVQSGRGGEGREGGRKGGEGKEGREGMEREVVVGWGG